MVSKKRVFNAVFPSLTDTTNPTPSATPVLGSSTFGASFTSAEASLEYEDTAAADILRRDRAWHNVTVFLALPNKSISLVDINGDTVALGRAWLKSCTPGVAEGLSFLLSTRSRKAQSSVAGNEDDLMEWYAHEVNRHFINLQLPSILRMLDGQVESNSLEDVARVLQTIQKVYLHPLKSYIVPRLPPEEQYELPRFLEDYHALVAKSMSLSGFADRLRKFLRLQGSIVLDLEQRGSQSDGDPMVEDDNALSVTAARNTVSKIMRGLSEAGLGGAQAQRLFAEVMSELLTAHVNTTYAGQWTSPSTIPTKLRDWVENRFARFVVEVLAALDASGKSQSSPSTQVTLADVASWQQRAICDLGALRLRELFEVVVDWDNDSRGAIEDLKQYVTTPAARTHLTTSFSAIISRRLLQPGASTIEILQVYTCIIRAFSVLDPKGVLLDRLARPIRRYLRERDDTVKILVGGLLADPSDDSGSADALVELASELNKITELSALEDDDGDLDWDDMSWMPDPIDAGPDFKQSKNSDVIGTLISLFDSKDVFVKEFQNIMAERLLKREFDFDKEIRVLELLKLRFGDAPLQACEVMLRDVLDSRRVDAVIRKDQQLDQDPKSQHHPEIHTKILSRLFWPSLHTGTFSIPSEIHALQSRYSSGFETLKQSRKLTWLPMLGRVTVELQLDDRTINEEVHTWQASVIHAFQDTDSDVINPATRTVEQLVEDLDMEESLVLNALTFWVSKLVLRETASATYTVLETLSASEINTQETAQAAQAAAAADAVSSVAAASAVRSEEDVAMENMNVFWQYILGMLTNQGTMPLPRIVMMLKFAVPGGFPYGNEELKEFLGKQVKEGKLEMVGGNYRIIK